MGQQEDDDFPPYARERVAAVGDALDAAFPPDGNDIPEPIVRLLLELSREQRRPREVTPTTIEQGRPHTIKTILSELLAAFLQAYRTK